MKRARAEFGAHEDARRSVWGTHDGVGPGPGPGGPLVVGSGLTAHLRAALTLAPPPNPRLALVDAMLAHFPTHLVAVQMSLATILDMLQPGRPEADPWGLRNIAPALFLRLGRDQEAYDFVKGWAAVGGSDGSPWHGARDRPASPRPAGHGFVRPLGADSSASSSSSLATSGANALEEPQSWLGGPTNLSHAAAVMLLKIRVHRALAQLQNASRALDCCLPKEIIDMIRAELLAGTGSVVAARRDLVTGGTIQVAEAIAVVKAQIWSLYKAIEKANKNFFPALLDPEEVLEKRPASYFTGPEQEAHVMVAYSYWAWKETPGAVSILWKMCRSPVATA